MLCSVARRTVTTTGVGGMGCHTRPSEKIFQLKKFRPVQGKCSKIKTTHRFEDLRPDLNSSRGELSESVEFFEKKVSEYFCPDKCSNNSQT